MDDTKSDIWLQVVGAYLVRDLLFLRGVLLCLAGFGLGCTSSATFRLVLLVDLRLRENLLLIRHRNVGVSVINNDSVSLKLLLLHLHFSLLSSHHR